MPNDRYLYPSLPLMLVPLAALLGWLAPGALRGLFIALAVVCVFVNAWFMPSSNYYHGDFYENAPLSRAMRQVYIDKYAPIREIGEYMNRQHPGAPGVYGGRKRSRPHSMPRSIRMAGISMACLCACCARTMRRKSPPF